MRSLVLAFIALPVLLLGCGGPLDVTPDSDPPAGDDDPTPVIDVDALLADARDALCIDNFAFAEGDDAARVTNTFQVPVASSVQDVSVSWSSDSPLVVPGTDGVVAVSRPGALFDSDLVVTLTATLELDGSSAAKTFEITVAANDSVEPMQQLTSPNLVNGGHYGGGLAVGGNRAAIVAGGEDTAYVYDRVGNEWQFATALDAGTGPYTIGGMASISRPFLFVGGGGEVVHVFREGSGGGYTHPQVLRGAGAEPNDFFGEDVEVEGARLFVGAHGDDGGDGNPVQNAGVVYVFEYNGSVWNETCTLRPEDSSWGAWFGRTISADGDTVVVGALGQRDALGDDTGAAYVFEWSGTAWVETAKLRASDAYDRDKFGVAVQIQGDMILVGAMYSDRIMSDTYLEGAVYVFERSGDEWVETGIIRPPIRYVHGAFGSAIAWDGVTAVIGAFHDDGDSGDLDANYGKAYIYELSPTGWTYRSTLYPPVEVANGNYGMGVAIDADDVLVAGSWMEIDGSFGAGLVSAWY